MTTAFGTARRTSGTAVTASWPRTRTVRRKLRHFYGTELVRAGVHLRVVQTLMRHESPATTAIYTEIDIDQLRAGITQLRAAA